jgi:hypothetical protein
MNTMTCLEYLVAAIFALGQAWAGGCADAPQDAAPYVADNAPAPTDQARGDGVDAWLDKLEAQSKKTKTLTAKVRYDRIQNLLGDEQRRFGKLIYEAGPPAKFAVHFESLLVGKALRPQNRWYVFDGRWLVEKLEDKKQFFKWQVVAPDAKPEDADPLGVGRGPFVLPVALKKDLLLKRFDVSLVAAEAEGDPKNSVHLLLKPKAGQRSSFTEIHLWYDRDTLLPQRARTLDESKNESIIDLMNVEVNAAIDGNLLDTSEPKEGGWEVQITPWGEK